MTDDRDPTEIAGIELPDAPEDVTERDGILSSQSEAHAVILGMTVGVISMLSGQYILMAAMVAAALGLEVGRVSGAVKRVPAAVEIRREPWYALGGILIGALPLVVL